jgi:hypothetical protein
MNAHRDVELLCRLSHGIEFLVMEQPTFLGAAARDPEAVRIAWQAA